MTAKYDVKTEVVILEIEQKSTKNDEEEIFRSAFRQFLVYLTKNLLLLMLEMVISFPTVAIPVLRGLNKNQNSDTFLFLTREQTSWYAIITFLVQTIGSILSGWLNEPIGRKKAMILVNILLIYGWYMLYRAASVMDIYLAGIFLGFGVGFMEGSIRTYDGEISHPSIRAILFDNITIVFGIFIIYTFGSISTLRIAVLYCILYLTITIVSVTFLPETPYWLLSKKREQKALKTLQWLHGWVSRDVIQKEFDQIKLYVKESNIYQDCNKTNKSSIIEKCSELLCRKTIRQFFIIFLCFAAVQLNGLFVLRPYIVQVFEVFQLPIDGKYASIIIISFMEVTSYLFYLLVVKSQGKRKLFLIALFCSSVCCILLSINGFYLFSIGTNSFHISTINANCTPSTQLPINLISYNNYFALVVFIILSFSAGIGATIPWMMLTEIIPIKDRGTVTGLAVALNNLIKFTVSKTYLDIGRDLSLAGALLFYGIICAAGFVIQYFILPETEGKTFEEIKYYFSYKTRKLIDLKIKSNPTRINNDD